MVDLARPWILLLLLPLAGWIWWWWASPAWVLLQAHPRFAPGGPSGVGTVAIRPPLPWLVRGVGLAVLVVALAGPRVREGHPGLPGEGLAIMVALDLSGSMGTRDLEGRSRLEVAREEVQRFIQGRPRDRIGLVTFSVEAVTRVPPTPSHAYLQRVVESLRISPLDEGTALGVGLGLAAHRLQPIDSPSRIVVLVTDGRSNTGALEPLPVARAAARLGVRVYTVGLGGEVGDDPLNEALLRQLSEAAGGRYFRARDRRGLEEVLAAIDGLEKGPLPSPEGRPWRPVHPALLVLGSLLLLLEGLLWTLPGGRIR